MENTASSPSTQIQSIPNPTLIKSNRKVFIVIIFALTIMLLGSAISFLYLKSAKKALPEQPKTGSSVDRKQNGYKIMDGSLYKISPGNEKELIVSLDELHHDQLEVTEIYSFKFSPDDEKVLLFTFGGINPFVLFYKHLYTKNVAFIGFAEEAVWSANSKYIAYTNKPADVGPLRLFVFDTQTNEEIETVQTKNSINTSYSNLRWSSDSRSISADYETRDDIPYGNIINKGEAQIILK